MADQSVQHLLKYLSIWLTLIKVLTKLGYLIDNPWNNALDRARGAGGILADVLMQRHLGVRPITLIGFSLGARVIFYALLELAKHKAYGIVQDVILLGATLTASTRSWCDARSVISGRFLNGFAKNDWVLNYLFRATSGGLSTVAGLRPIQNVPGLENVDVTDKIAGHMSYRTFMPLILDQLGFPVSADHFNEPEVHSLNQTLMHTEAHLLHRSQTSPEIE
jgi:pimeloyl-ACP methyl ester carboxylesterase